MSFTVRVIQDDLSKSVQRLRDRMPGIADLLIRKVAFDIVAEVAELVPVDTGRYRAGWRVSLDVLAADDAVSDTVSVFSEGGQLQGIEITNPVEYGRVIEEGTATRPPGNHLAIAMDKTRRRLTFGRGKNSIMGQVQAAWEGS